MKKYKIAVIGGGFTGLSVAAHTIRSLRLQKKYAQIKIFDEKGLRGGRIFSSDLSNNFTLNHEANFMGAVNAFGTYNGTTDFYLWLKKYLYVPLKSLGGKTIAQQYTGLNLRDEKAHLPRNLYGHYLEFRLNEMLEQNTSDNHSFSYVISRVEDVERSGKKVILTHTHGEELFDIVVFCTGFWFKSNDTSDAVYRKEFTAPKDKPIGIIGSSLSGIELALALIEQGYKKVKLFSRNGRLPKVRGDYTAYTPTYLTNKFLEKLANHVGHLDVNMMLYLLKREFELAYTQKDAGLYQKKGINWMVVLNNDNPIKQLKEDIRCVAAGEELVWRSVLQSVYEHENQLWRGLHELKRGEISSKYSSLLLSYIAPMPLTTAKKLYRNVQRGSIELVSRMRGYEKGEAGYKVQTENGETTVTYLVDGRGPSKNIDQNQFLSQLITKGLLEKNPAGGILINDQFQAVVKKRAQRNIYLVGPMTYGERPHNSTVFAGECAENIAWYITRSMQGKGEEKNNESLYEHMNQLLIAMQDIK